MKLKNSIFVLMITITSNIYPMHRPSSPLLVVILMLKEEESPLAQITPELMPTVGTISRTIKNQSKTCESPIDQGKISVTKRQDPRMFTGYLVKDNEKDMGLYAPSAQNWYKYLKEEYNKQLHIKL